MIYRVEVGGSEPDAGVRQQIAELGIGLVFVRRVFLIDSEMTGEQAGSIARELLADPIVEQAHLFNHSQSKEGSSRIEVHLKPGVMDPVAASTEMAIADRGLPCAKCAPGGH